MFEVSSNYNQIKDRKEKIESEVSSFEKEVFIKFSEDDAKKIKSALDFMLKIHLPQKDRVDGKPFASHPLAVAEKVMNMSNDPELVISALLHDSVEDQADRIFIERIERKNLGGGLSLKFDETAKDKYKATLNTWSFREIEDRFGPKIKYYVENMTNHDFNSLAEHLNLEGENKIDFINKLYAEHVENIISDPNLLILKVADLTTNINLRSLDPGSEKYHKLKRKYKSVIENVLEKLKTISEDNPIYSKKDAIVKELTQTYEEQYR